MHASCLFLRPISCPLLAPLSQRGVYQRAHSIGLGLHGCSPTLSHERASTNIASRLGRHACAQLSCPLLSLLLLRPPPDAHPRSKLARAASQAEVQQQKQLPTIRSYLKLYTTIGIPKLAALAESDEPTFREHLQCLKHKSHALACSGGEPLSGTWGSSAEVDFYVDSDVAHVADTSLVRKHSDYFVKQINKLEEIISTLK
jgi:hypothetical protein